MTKRTRKTETKTARPAKASRAAKTATQPPRAPATKPATGASLVKPDYKKMHQPDELGQRISAATSDEKGRVDLAKLRALAERNGAWNPAYERLNPGQQRMNVGNRLRAKLRKGEQVVWA